MQEIKIAGNKTGLQVLIDEPPDVGLLHNDDFNVRASALDLTLSEHIQNYYKYKSRDKPKAKEGVGKKCHLPSLLYFLLRNPLTNPLFRGIILNRTNCSFNARVERYGHEKI